MGFSLGLYAHYYALINPHDTFQLQTHVSIYVSDMPATFQLTFRLARVPERQVQTANRDYCVVCCVSSIGPFKTSM